MTAFNIVRFRVKPGREEEFIAAHRNALDGFPGGRRFVMLRTGAPADRTYCIVGEWKSFDDIVSARSRMIAMLDGFRHCLEDLGNGLGVTDPISGEALLDLAKPKPKRRAKPAARKAAAKRPKPAAKRKPARKAKPKAPARSRR